MTQKTIHRCKEIISSRYTHLFFGLMILYGISAIMTHTTSFDKIMENLKRYYYVDYETKILPFSKNIRELKFYRGKCKEKLDTLTRGLFDYEKRDETQSYFMKNGFLYDSWQESENRSCLLAKIVGKGVYQRESPDEVRFDYLILGEKEIVPFLEYINGPAARPFVSSGERAIYLHKDSLEPILRWYFESLWAIEPKESYHFYDDPLSYSLYRDLQEICETILIKRHYMDKQKAQETFLEEGFKVFLPTMLSMGARMVADRNSNFPSDYQYLKACLIGLSRNPNHTMFYILNVGGRIVFSPLAIKGWKAFSQSLDLTYPDQITLEQISEISQNTFKSLENSP